MYQKAHPKALPAEEQLRLVALAQAGDREARDRLVVTTLGLVAHRAHRLHAIDRAVDVEDLVQEGVEGVLAAVARFDTTRGVRFITYATPWVDNAIRRALWRNREVALHVANKLGILREFRDLEEELGHEEAARATAEKHGMRAETVVRASEQLARAAPRSLEAPANPWADDSPPLGDTLAGDGPAPDETAAEEELRAELARVLGGLRLGVRGADVLEARVLAHPEDEECLRTIGDRYGVSRERIRQVQVEVVAALRAAVLDSPVLRAALSPPQPAGKRPRRRKRRTCLNCGRAPAEGKRRCEEHLELRREAAEHSRKRAQVRGPVEYGGERLSVTEWSRRTGISRPLIAYRLSVGWSPERALTEPPSESRRPRASAAA